MDTCAGGDLVHIVRELIQICPERLKRCFICLKRFGLLALDGADRCLLRKVCFSGRSRRIVQRRNGRLVRRFDLCPGIVAKDLLRIGVVDLIQCCFQIGTNRIGLRGISDGQLQIGSCYRARVEDCGIFVVCACVVGGDKIFALLIELEAHGAACIRRGFRQNRRAGVAAILVLRTICDNRCALIRAVTAGICPEMRGRTLNRQRRFCTRRSSSRAGFLEAQRAEGVYHVRPVHFISIDVVERVGRPLHMRKVNFIVVFQYIVGVRKVLIDAGRCAVEHCIVDECVPDTVGGFAEIAGTRLAAGLFPEVGKCGA